MDGTEPVSESLDATVVDTVKFVGRLTEQVDRIRATLRRRADGFNSATKSSLYQSEIVYEKTFALVEGDLSSLTEKLKEMLTQASDEESVTTATLSSNVHQISEQPSVGALVVTLRLKDTQGVSKLTSILDDSALEGVSCTTRMYSCVNIPLPSTSLSASLAAPAAPAAPEEVVAAPAPAPAPVAEASPPSPQVVLNDAKKPPFGRPPSGNSNVAPSTSPTLKRLGAGKKKRARRNSFSAEAGIAPSQTDEPHTVHEKSSEARLRIGAAVKNNLMFKYLDKEQLSIVVDAMFEKKVTKNENIIVQGEDGDFFYVVDQGHFNIYVGGEWVHEERAGGSFGELALMYGAPRAATVTASAESVVWALDRQTFTSVIVNSAHKRRQENYAFVMALPMMAELATSEHRRVADVLYTSTFDDGAVVVREGEKGDKFYFVMSGEAVVTKKVGDDVVELGRVKAGGFFGELALLSASIDSSRAATVTAAGEGCKFAFMERGSFTRICAPMKEFFDRHREEHYEN